MYKFVGLEKAYWIELKVLEKLIILPNLWLYEEPDFGPFKPTKQDDTTILVKAYNEPFGLFFYNHF